MVKFPKIEEHQFVIVRALRNTGQVLGEDFNLKLNENQKVYSVFENISDVELYVKSIFDKRSDVEIWLYDCNNAMLKCYSPPIPRL